MACGVANLKPLVSECSSLPGEPRRTHLSGGSGAIPGGCRQAGTHLDGQPGYQYWKVGLAPVKFRFARYSGVAGDLLRFCVSVSAWLERLAETVEQDDVGVIVAGAGDSQLLAIPRPSEGLHNRWLRIEMGQLGFGAARQQLHVHILRTAWDPAGAG